MAKKDLLNWLRFHPLRLGLILFGVALLLFSMNVRAYSFASASLSQNEFWMQPGSDVLAQLNIQIDSSELVPISFSIQEPQGIALDGQLYSISTTGYFARNLTLRVANNVPPGDYPISLTMHASLNGQTYEYPFSILVHVAPKQRVTYFTSANSTLAPTIASIRVSPQRITLHRGDVQYAHVSFVNQGNATDYAIEFNPMPIGLFASILSANHSFVKAGDRVESDIELRAFDSSPFEQVPISIYARNRVTQEKTFLGNVVVSIEKINHVNLAVPFSTYEVEKNGIQQSYLTLQNTEASDLDLLLQSSSPQLEFSSTQVHVPAKSSLSVPFTLKGSDSLGSSVETIYAVNSAFSTSVSFGLKTIPVVSLPAKNESRTIKLDLTNDSGIEWKDIVFDVRNLPNGWKASVSPQHASLLQGDVLVAVIELTAAQKQVGNFTLLVFNEGILVKSIPVKSDPNPDSFSQISGFVSGISAPVVGLIVLILAALLIFSADFRKRVRDAMPKPKPIVVKPKSIETATSTTTKTESKSSETETTIVPAPKQ